MGGQHCLILAQVIHLRDVR